MLQFGFLIRQPQCASLTHSRKAASLNQSPALTGGSRLAQNLDEIFPSSYTKWKKCCQRIFLSFKQLRPH